MGDIRFEYAAIEGPRVPSKSDQPFRDKDVVGEEIVAFYEHAAEMGGRVVGDHVMTVETTLLRGDHTVAGGPPKVAGQVGGSVLYLVAELPDDQPD